MKTRILLLLSTILAGEALAQGTVDFRNGPGSAVSNLVTMQRVPGGSTFKAALYCAADGVTCEEQFVQIGSAVTFSSAGYFYGGTRTSTPAIPPGGWGMFQVRVFEAAYGSTYEEVWMNIGGLRGRSQIIRVKTGDPTYIPGGGPPESPGSLNDLGPMFVAIWDEEEPQLQIGDRSTLEGNDGVSYLSFTISTRLRYANYARMDFATADLSARAGEDYAGTNGTIAFLPPGPSSYLVQIPVYGDTNIEPDEILYLTFTNCMVSAFPRSLVCTIIDDDCRATLSLDWSPDSRPGLTIGGCTRAGGTYRVEVAERVTGPYTAVTNLVIPQSPYVWIDTISTLGRERYYRAFLLP